MLKKKFRKEISALRTLKQPRDVKFDDTDKRCEESNASEKSCHARTDTEKRCHKRAVTAQRCQEQNDTEMECPERDDTTQAINRDSQFMAYSA